MAIHDYNIANASGLNVRADINAVLAAILSNNSNATAPTTTLAGMFWYDTTAGILKQRNSANSAWVDVWVVGAGRLATLESPTFTGNVALPSTTTLNGGAIALLASPTFTGNATFANITAAGTISLPVATAIGAVSATEISYLDGVTSAIQTQLNAKADATATTNALNTKVATTSAQALHATDALRISGQTLSLYKGNSASESVTIPVPAAIVLPAAAYDIGCFIIGRPANITSYAIGSTIAGTSLYNMHTNQTRTYDSAWASTASTSSNATPSLVNTGSWRCISPAPLEYAHASPGLWVRYA
jgi:hypothetical protein